VVSALFKAGADFRNKNRRGLTALRLTSVSVPGRLNNIVYRLSMPSTRDPKEMENEIVIQQRLANRFIEMEFKRATLGRAAAQRLLKSAGAKE